VVEGALAVALMAVGQQRPSALAAVLVYRFISFWMVTAAGWLVYLIGKRQGVRREASRWQFIWLKTPPRAAGHPKRAGPRSCWWATIAGSKSASWRLGCVPTEGSVRAWSR
jgi:hypothetical protein